jgi:hypothetical protein
VTGQTEELLGWEGRDTREGRFQGGAKWHPSKEIAVMDFSTRRGPAVIAVWIHGKGVKLIHKTEFLEMLEKRKLKMSSRSTGIDIQDMKCVATCGKCLSLAVPRRQTLPAECG